MARFLLEQRQENDSIHPVVRVSVEPRSLSPSSPLSSSPSPPPSPVHFKPSQSVIKPSPIPPVAVNTERKSVMQKATVFQKPKVDPFWNYSQQPKTRSKFSFRKPMNGIFSVLPWKILISYSEATEMLNLSIVSYTKMKCSFYQNGDGELCCNTVKIDGEFKSGVKIKGRF